MTATTFRGISFPAILEGLGPEQVVAEAAHMGQTEFILCATIYTGYRLVMPRHPRQIYQLEEGLVFYPCDPSLYRDTNMVPQATRDFAGRDLFAEAARAGEKHGVGLIGWVSCFANRRLATTHPENAVENLYGSRDRLFLCFNNPNVIHYCLSMFRELATRYPIVELMADKIPQSQLELVSFGGLIDPLLRLCGSICFCEHCLAQAARDGVDLAGAKRRALEVAEASRTVGQHVRAALQDDLRGDTEIPLFLVEEPLFAEVLRWRMRCIVRFFQEARVTLDGVRPGVKLSACVVPPVKIGHDFTQPRAWLGAQSYRYFAPAVDTLHCVIHWDAPVIEYDTRRARGQVDGTGANCELCVHVPAYGRFAPGQIEGLTRAALRQGADSVCYFCHDLLDQPMLEAIAAATAKFGAAR
jgi:hypothetical protein